jgi:hypothetical protein
MKSLPLAIACLAATASLAACTKARDAAARTALDCPARAGKLMRASIAADGRTCDYADAAGDQLELKLLPVAGSPDATLTPVEQVIQAQTPAVASAAKTGAAAQADAQARADAADADDDDAREAGKHDRADISLPGVHIVAAGDKAQVEVGGVHVDASGERAVVRTARDVKMIGNPFVLARNGYRATYMVTRDDAPDGFALVGYEAGGPKTGPLTVAVIKARGHSNGVFAQGRRLVRLNGGV